MIEQISNLIVRQQIARTNTLKLDKAAKPEGKTHEIVFLSQKSISNELVAFFQTGDYLAARFNESELSNSKTTSSFTKNINAQELG